MVAGALFATDLTIDPGIGEPFRERRAEQDVVEPQPGIALPPAELVVPERVERLIGMARCEARELALPRRSATSFRLVCQYGPRYHA